MKNINLLKHLIIESLKEIKNENKVEKILEKIAKERGYDSFKHFFGDATFIKSDEVIEIFKDFATKLKNDNS